MDSSKTAIVVLNWNGCQDTLECLESLRQLNPPGCKIFVVDNGSTDGSVKQLKEKFPEHEIVETGSNLGFTGGNNIGIERALQGGADQIILLNNDTVVDSDFAIELERAAENNPEAGILCSKIYCYDHQNIIWYAGASFSAFFGWGRLRGYGEVDTGQYDQIEETPRPSGCSMMVTRSLCEKTGVFDTDYFCYAEDTDWGIRAAAKGFKVLYVPTSKVWHKGYQSTGGAATGVSLYYNVRNILLCLQKNFPASRPLGSFRNLAVVITSLLSLLTTKVPKGLGVKRIFQGYKDFRRKKFGELKL